MRVPAGYLSGSVNVVVATLSVTVPHPFGTSVADADTQSSDTKCWMGPDPESRRYTTDAVWSPAWMNPTVSNPTTVCRVMPALNHCLASGYVTPSIWMPSSARAKAVG